MNRSCIINIYVLLIFLTVASQRSEAQVDASFWQSKAQEARDWAQKERQNADYYAKNNAPITAIEQANLALQHEEDAKKYDRLAEEARQRERQGRGVTPQRNQEVGHPAIRPELLPPGYHIDRSPPIIEKAQSVNWVPWGIGAFIVIMIIVNVPKRI